MFNWFDKLLVKIAKKILNKYAPTGEFIAYINEQEEKVLKKLGGYGQPINETGIKSFVDWFEWLKTAGKIGGSAAKYYIDYKDQKRKNKVTEQAYRQYAEDVANAKAEAQAAIDVNLTPMEISNIPQTKADVSDFTAVAHGGLMTLPNRQRKRYAYQGFVEDDDIEIIEPESLGDFELQQEEGVNIGEQVFHDTGDDRTNAQNVWQSGSIDQEIYQLDFEIFFKSGDWMDHISRGTVQGDTQMASAPGIPGIEGLRHGGRPGYQFGGGPQQGLMPQQGMMPQGMMPQQGLRPGYEMGLGPVGRGMGREEIETESEYISTRDNDTFEVDTINRIYEEQGNDGLQAYLERNPDLKDKYVIVTDGMSGELTVMPNKLHPDNMDMEKIMIDFENLAGENKAQGGRIGYDDGGSADAKLMARVQELQDEGLDFAAAMAQAMKELSSGKAQGGRIGYAQGSGIMDLGGLEKDYRTTGGFVPLGGQERADDVPARLSKNEFVMTADAVRAAGGGSINKVAQRMYDTTKHLEASPQSNRMIS